MFYRDIENIYNIDVFTSNDLTLKDIGGAGILTPIQEYLGDADRDSLVFNLNLTSTPDS